MNTATLVVYYTNSFTNDKTQEKRQIKLSDWQLTLEQCANYLRAHKNAAIETFTPLAMTPPVLPGFIAFVKDTYYDVMEIVIETDELVGEVFSLTWAGRWE
jgi:hypothetical protein